MHINMWDMVFVCVCVHLCNYIYFVCAGQGKHRYQSDPQNEMQHLWWGIANPQIEGT